MRTLGVGTPRRLQGRWAAVFTLILATWSHVSEPWSDGETPSADHSSAFIPLRRFELLPLGAAEGPFNHGLLGRDHLRKTPPCSSSGALRKRQSGVSALNVVTSCR